MSEMEYVSIPFGAHSRIDMHYSHQRQCFLIRGSKDQKQKSWRRRTNGVLLQNIKICPFNFVYEALVDT